MKGLGYILMLAFLLSDRAIVSAQAPTQILYNGAAQECITDLRACLQGQQAGTIELAEVPLENRTGQEYFLEVKQGHTRIRYTCRQSLENAVYGLLDHLGFRWYGPAAHWAIVPETIKLRDIHGAWKKPVFRNRCFFGTGGLDFGISQAYDPDNRYKHQWYAWKRRNRFNADFEAVGHTGQAFYQANKRLLDVHPQWFVNESGKVNGRIAIDQPLAVKAYKDWVRKCYNAADGPFKVLGVDPEDGRGGADDPLPKSMAGIRNHADKWWWLANEVAKDYPEQDPNTRVTAYAYGDGPYNALVPSFSLRRNVYPVITPYAFQTAYIPDQMVKKWASVISGTMGIYDYWNITQWSLGLPQFNIYTVKEKLTFWSRNKIDGIYLETTDAAGPMGHALWLTSRMAWDPEQNFEQLYRQYLTDCFGKGAPAIRKMLDRWSRNNQGATEVGMSLRDLRDATDLIPASSPEARRLADLKAYVHYMKLYYGHDGTQRSKDAIFRYLYSIHHLMLVQTAAFIGQGYITPLDQGNITPSGAGVQPLSYAAIERQFREDLSGAPPAYLISSMQFDFARVQYNGPIPTDAWRFGGFHCAFFFRAPSNSTVRLDIGAEGTAALQLWSGEEVFAKETVGATHFDYTEEIDGRTWKMKRYILPVIKDRLYYIKTSGGFSRLKVNTEGIVLFKQPGAEDFDNYAYPLQYFYVPRNISEIYFFDAQPEGTNGRGYLVPPDGQLLKRQPTGMKQIYKVAVPAGQSGKVWTANFGHPSWSFKNIPNYTSLQKFQYAE